MFPVEVEKNLCSQTGLMMFAQLCNSCEIKIGLAICIKRHMDDKTLNTLSSVVVQCLKLKDKQFLMDLLVILDNSDFALHNHS